MIIVFYQQTPFELLESIKPHILVKGGDYTKESIIGKEWVNEVKIFPLIKDNNHTYSTTSIIEKLNK
jgi:D-beta-D-heptose 7-phosphate kinase/D-beta-D-heptose 1-phosphate adenosyltransferase